MAAPQVAESESAAKSSSEPAPRQPDAPLASTPVEMSNLASRSNDEEHLQPDATAGAGQDTPDALQQPSQAQDAPSSSPPSQQQEPSKARHQSEAALGPATDAPVAVPPPTTSAGPALNISLMLTTGTRHPYKIDEKYLRNRKVDAVSADGDFDPREMSGYKLKELIWTDWRAEWEPRPASPSAIRLIILGRLLDDKAALKDSPFKLDDVNVVHMTVKPADFLDDDEGAGGKAGKGQSTRGQDGEERTAGCRCVIL